MKFHLILIAMYDNFAHYQQNTFVDIISLFIHSKLTFTACRWKFLILPQRLYLPSFSDITNF